MPALSADAAMFGLDTISSKSGARPNQAKYHCPIPGAESPAIAPKTAARIRGFRWKLPRAEVSSAGAPLLDCDLDFLFRLVPAPAMLERCSLSDSMRGKRSVRSL